MNLASPNPLPYAEFMRALRRAAGVPIGLPATKWMLEIGAFFMRTETELVLKSRRVVPGLLLAEGCLRTSGLAGGGRGSHRGASLVFGC